MRTVGLPLEGLSPVNINSIVNITILLMPELALEEVVASSLIFRSATFGIAAGSLIPAICWLRQFSSALGAVV